MESRHLHCFYWTIPLFTGALPWFYGKVDQHWGQHQHRSRSICVPLWLGIPKLLLVKMFWQKFIWWNGFSVLRLLSEPGIANVETSADQAEKENRFNLIETFVRRSCQIALSVSSARVERVQTFCGQRRFCALLSHNRKLCSLQWNFFSHCLKHDSCCPCGNPTVRDHSLLNMFRGSFEGWRIWTHQLESDGTGWKCCALQDKKSDTATQTDVGVLRANGKSENQSPRRLQLGKMIRSLLPAVLPKEGRVPTAAFFSLLQCERFNLFQGVKMEAMRFRFDGQPINETDTPSQVRTSCRGES